MKNDTMLSQPTAPSTLNPSVGQGEILQVKNFVPDALRRQWVELINVHRHEWAEKINFVYMSTYGLAWYIMLELGLGPRYHMLAKEANEMVSRLPEYRDYMISRAAQYLKGPNGETGLPVIPRSQGNELWCDCGLHISEKTRGAASPHADYEGLLPYPHMLLEEGTTAYSAVLAVAMPKAGGNLIVWDERVLPKDEVAFYDRIEESAHSEYTYEEGMLTIFDSYKFHQITPITVSKKNPQRITGVTHFLYKASPTPHFECWF